MGEGGKKVCCMQVCHTDLAAQPSVTTAPVTVPAVPITTAASSTTTAPVPMTCSPAAVVTQAAAAPVVADQVVPPPIAPVAGQHPHTVSCVTCTAHYYQQQCLWICELDFDQIPDGIKDLSLADLQEMYENLLGQLHDVTVQ